jgi:hypothetical protein
MAAQGTPQPEGQQPTPGAQPGAGPAQQQANPLQTTIAQIAKGLEQMAQQNPIVQGELMEARTALVKALQKTMMAGRPQQDTQAPQPQGAQ